jgi:UDP-N-acetyl-D-glucosamine dehydrogenase
MPEYVVRRVTSLLNSRRQAVNGARILLLGLAYKAGTSDWRESPAMRTAELLLALGADVRAHDAHVPIDARLGPPVTRVELTDEELERADLVVLLVDHPELPYEDIAARARLVLDTRGRLRDLPFSGEVL